MNARQRLTRRVHAEANRLGLSEEERVETQFELTGHRSLSTMKNADLQKVLDAFSAPVYRRKGAPREALSSQKAETYLRDAFGRAGRPGLAPSFDEIELWANPRWRKNNGSAVAREALPAAIRVSRDSAVLWNPDQLDAHVQRQLSLLPGGAK